MTFEYTDKVIKIIDKQLIEEFQKLNSLASFDNVNVIGRVSTAFQNINLLLMKIYLLLANRVYHESRSTDEDAELDEAWVRRILNDYDPVSKYVFTNEFDRRRARLSEALIASNNKSQELNAALHALAFMCRIYADRITDEATMQAYVDDGVERIRWVAEKDNRTCSTCKERDGKIYDIDEVPDDPHPNCRCKRERVRDGT